MQIPLPFDQRGPHAHSAESSAHVVVASPPPPPPPFLPPKRGIEPLSLEFVRHPRARRYVLRVTENGGVRVTIPRRGSKKEARAFAERERPWIERQRRKWQARIKERAAREPREGYERLEGEARERIVERARRELPLRLMELAARFGLRVTRVSIRNQKWRWGSCSPDGHICLNWRLVTMPDAVRDYVLIHELMHLKRLDHSPAFWKLVERACPDYRELRRQLCAIARC